MRFTLTLKCDNAAFSPEEGGTHAETARILRKLADNMESSGDDRWRLVDYNGNSVGSAEFTREKGD